MLGQLVVRCCEGGSRVPHGSVLPPRRVYIEDSPCAKHKHSPGRAYVSSALLSLWLGRQRVVQKFTNSIGRICPRGACRACPGKPEAEHALKVLDDLIQKQ